ncbi:MAG: ATP-grasp domain-containing protein, partial [Lachnospira sp.]|nr:ATP-grasp domain-containing protein [Lachnospira sp.]
MMNIVVIAGGTSSERDVSIVTGKMVTESLRRNGHNANMIDVFLGSKEYDTAEEFFVAKNDLDILANELKEASADIITVIEKRSKKGKGFFGSNVLEYCKAADLVFIALHGSNGEDGKVQAVFDLLGIKYTGTDYISSAISMNKQLTKKMLIVEGVPMPKGIMLKRGHKIEYVPYPCVVKPCCGGSSVGVSIANDEEEFVKAVEEAFSYEDEIVVEEYVKGREFSVGVIDGKALPIIEIEPLEGFYDYKNKYDGSTK